MLKKAGVACIFASSILGFGFQLMAAVKIEVQGDLRIVTSDGIPDHPTGQFPGPENPNRIAAQDYVFQMPAQPVEAEKVTPLAMSPFGIALNGIVFDPFAAEWWNNDRHSGWQLEPMSGLTSSLGIDDNHAHVQPSGAYHYHGLPVGLLNNLADSTGPVHLGYAADGFPIYAAVGFRATDGVSTDVRSLKSSYSVKRGARGGGPGGNYDGRYIQDYEYVPGSGDLDECNGLTGKTPEFPAGTYLYVITETFPFIPRFYRGTPDSSFIKKRPGGPNGNGGLNRPGGPGQNPPRPPGGDSGRPPSGSRPLRPVGR